MDASTLRLGLIVAIFGLTAFLLWKDRENVERIGIIFLRRTENGIDFIDRVANRFPRFWNFYSWGGVLAAAVSLPVISYSMYELVSEMFSTGAPAKGAGVLYPSTGSSVSQSPGAIGIPAEYWFISIAVVMVVHELSHGIVARAEDFEISSVGVLVFGIIPGAFVEPKGGLPGGEEEEANPHGAWDQGNWVSRVKILAAGSWANYVTAGVFLLLALGFTSATSYSNGIVYQAQSDYPAVQAGLTNGTLQEVNNQRIRGIEDIKAATEGIKPGDTVILNTTEGVFNVTTTSIQDFDGGYIGLQFVEIDTKYKGGFENYSDLVEWFASLLNIVAFVNLGIGLFNMLPVKPLDGGHILEALVERFAGEEYAQQVNTWSISVILLIVAVILYTIIGPF